jgi:hypothetical protein
MVSRSTGDKDRIQNAVRDDSIAFKATFATIERRPRPQAGLE